MTPQLPPGGWPLLITLLLALGVPTAAGLAFAQQVTQEPWKAVGLALLYEVIVFVGGSLAKVWQALESRWVTAIADGIDTTARSLRPGYRRRYLRHIIHQHRFFDVKGLTTQGPYSLKLEQVFVALRLDPQTTQRAGINPIPNMPPTLQRGRHTLWDYLHAPQMSDQHLAILGPPGSGKTTLLRHAALAMAARSWRTNRTIPRRLPILLFLRDHAGAIKENPSLPLAQAIHDRLARLDGPIAPPGWFVRQLRAGRCVVLLDGLDEVADSELRKQVVAWVERQMAAHATNRFVVTSRPFGYRSNPLTGVTVLEVQPLTQTDIARFIHNWYLANEIMSAQCQDAGVRAAAKQGADDLLQRLRNAPNLADLAVNPLLLTMIANVHRYRSTLPGRRVELYAEICEVFLGKRRRATGVEVDLTPAQKQSVLQALAYRMMCAEQREIVLAEALAVIQEPLRLVSPWIDGAAFLKDIENNSGLLLERENGVYSFAHLTFQEYLAAVAIRKHGWAQDVVAYVGTSWWHETIRLHAAQDDATLIVDACLANDRPSIEALTLAIECREEAMQLQQVSRDKLETLLTSGVDDPDSERRRLVAETLLELRLRRMVHLDERRAIDTSLVTCAEYQLFLDERRAQGVYHQPDHWTDMRFVPGQGRTPVLGMRHSDAIAFCDWLSQRAGGTWRYRLPERGEGKSEIEPLQITVPFPTGVGCWVGSSPTARLSAPQHLRSETRYRYGLKSSGCAITCTTEFSFSSTLVLMSLPALASSTSTLPATVPSISPAPLLAPLSATSTSPAPALVPTTSSAPSAGSSTTTSPAPALVTMIATSSALVPSTSSAPSLATSPVPLTTTVPTISPTTSTSPSRATLSAPFNTILPTGVPSTVSSDRLTPSTLPTLLTSPTGVLATAPTPVPTPSSVLLSMTAPSSAPKPPFMRSCTRWHPSRLNDACPYSYVPVSAAITRFEIWTLCRR